MTKKFEAMDVQNVEKELETSIENGLSSSQAESRLAKYGQNELVE